MKYKIPSLAEANKYIDVTTFVVDSGYAPIYENTTHEICALKRKTSAVAIEVINELDSNLSLLKDFILTNKTRAVFISESKVSYAYTYFIYDDTPTDVYKIDFKDARHENKSMYFRIEGNKFIPPFDERGWVIWSK